MIALLRTLVLILGIFFVGLPSGLTDEVGTLAPPALTRHSTKGFMTYARNFVKKILANDSLSRRELILGTTTAAAIVGIAILVPTRIWARDLLVPQKIEVLKFLIEDIQVTIETGEGHFFVWSDTAPVKDKLFIRESLVETFGEDEAKAAVAYDILIEDEQETRQELMEERRKSPSVYSTHKTYNLEFLSRIKTRLEQRLSRLQKEEVTNEEKFLVALSQVINDIYDQENRLNLSSIEPQLAYLMSLAAMVDGDLKRMGKESRLVDDLREFFLLLPMKFDVSDKKTIKQLANLIQGISEKYISEKYVLIPSIGIKIFPTRDGQVKTIRKFYVAIYRIEAKKEVLIDGHPVVERYLMRVDNQSISNGRKGGSYSEKTPQMIDIYLDVIDEDLLRLKDILFKYQWRSFLPLGNPVVVERVVRNLNGQPEIDPRTGKPWITKLEGTDRQIQFIERVEQELKIEMKDERKRMIFFVLLHERFHILNYWSEKFKESLEHLLAEYDYYEKRYAILLDKAERIDAEQEVNAFLASIAYGKMPYLIVEDIFENLILLHNTPVPYRYATKILAKAMYQKAIGRSDVNVVDIVARPEETNPEKGLIYAVDAFDAIAQHSDEEIQKFAEQILEERYGYHLEELEKVLIGLRILESQEFDFLIESKEILQSL